MPGNLYGTHSCIRRWFHLTCNRKYIHRWNNLYCIDIHTCTLGRKTSLTHHIGIFNTLLFHCRFLYSQFYIISSALTFYLVFIKTYRKLVKTSKLKNHVYFGICYKEMFFRSFLIISVWPSKWKSDTNKNEELEQRNESINLHFHIKFPVNQSSLYMRLVSCQEMY